MGQFVSEYACAVTSGCHQNWRLCERSVKDDASGQLLSLATGGFPASDLAAVASLTFRAADAGGRFRRLHTLGPIAKNPRTRRCRVTYLGREVMGTSLYSREQHFPNVRFYIAAQSSSRKAKNSRHKDPCADSV